jgi:hypothetical protein
VLNFFNGLRRVSVREPLTLAADALADQIDAE